MKLLLTFLLAFSISAFSSECPTVNLVTEKNSPFQKIPVYDQDGIGICYAYAAAQLTDFYLIKKGAKKRSVHPAWLAMSYSLEFNKDKLESGKIDDAIQAMMNYMNCDYDKVASALGKWAKTANVSEAEMLNFIERFAVKVKYQYHLQKSTAIVTRLPADNTYVKPPVGLTATKEPLKIDIKKAIEESAAGIQCGTNPTWEKLLPALESLSLLDSDELIFKLLFPVCANSPQPIAKIPAPQRSGNYFTTDEEMQKSIMNHLSTYKSPVSVSYCSRFLKNPQYDGINNGLWKTRTSDIKADCQNHESLLVGMKKMNNQCHFLLRNTWGSGFNSSNKNQKCLCKDKKTGAFVDNCTFESHNNGKYIVEGCWRDAKQFSKNTYGMTVIK